MIEIKFGMLIAITIQSSFYKMFILSTIGNHPTAH